jgi:hypothetical protein
MATNTLEGVLVALLPTTATRSLAPQASAVTPFGVFHDLRWLSVYHDSWTTFGLELVGMLVVRGLLTTLMVWESWPGFDRPRIGRLFGRGVSSTALAAVFLAPSVSLLFGLAVVPVSWLFLAAVPLALAVALIIHPVSVHGDWWRRTVPFRALGWVALSFLVFSATGMITSTSPVPVGIVAAALVGLFNARAWFGMVHALVNRPPARHVLPIVPVALATMVAIAGSGAYVGFSDARTAQTEIRAGPRVAGRQPGPPVLVVSGYGSRWNGRPVHPIPGRFDEIRFSYAGLDSNGDPRPYRSADTVKPLLQLARMMAAQVTAVQRRTGQPVAVVAESEGALVAETYLAATPHPPVRRLVMASPLLDPGRVSYPLDGAGWGVASRSGMEVMVSAFQPASPIDLSPTSPFLASVNQEAPLLQKLATCPVPGVSRIALLPLADAVAASSSSRLAFPSIVVPAFHGGLLSDSSAAALVGRILRGGTAGSRGWWQLAEDTIRWAASAWQVPDLPPNAFPGRGVTGQTAVSNCTTIDRDLHRGIYQTPAAATPGLT